MVRNCACFLCSCAVVNIKLPCNSRCWRTLSINVVLDIVGYSKWLQPCNHAQSLLMERSRHALKMAMRYSYNLLIVFGTAAFGQLDFSLGIVGVVWMFSIGAWITVVSTTKRLHDINRRGWWQLVGLVPVFGRLAVIIVCGFVKGTIGPNRFGDNPKELV